MLFLSWTQVHLVEQHFKECQLHLGHNYTLTPISGDSVEKDFFGKVVEDSHLVICTAQILYNAMISAEDLKHIDLSGQCKNIFIFISM